MRNAGRLIEILDKMENGPVISEKEFDLKLIAKRTQELVKEFELVFDGSSIVNSDDEMADRCFQAGLTLAVDAGVYCTSNGRRLTWTRREIEDVIKYAPRKMEIGFGRDAHRDFRRDPEDPRPPTIIGGPVGNPLPEELFLPIMQSYIQEPILDAVINGTLGDVYGRVPRAGSPWELLSGWHEAEMSITAAKRAGREGISIGCVQTATGDIAELSATSYGGFRQTDFHHIGMISELKTDYKLLNKMTHLIKTDSIIHTFCNPIYGGLAGGAEGIAVMGVAGMILLQMMYMTTTHSTSPTHPFFQGCNTTPEILWGTSLFTQALSRNTPFMVVVVTTPVSGPGLKTLFYESAAMALTATVSGAARIMGPRSAAGTVPGHCSGLEARFAGEVGRAAAGMSRLQADELVKKIVPEYIDLLATDLGGQRFDQVYDMSTLSPTAEWLGTYDTAKEEMAKLGLDLG
jgi:methylamine---corrinoid protein Co-methyltransferase